jgi:hypothetical protein
MVTRDTTKMNDIDINYTINPNDVEKQLQDLNIKEFLKDDRNYIRVGPKTRTDYLEGFYINPFESSPEFLECKMNSLMFMIDYNNKENKHIITLVDLFGDEALSQALNKIWDAPISDYNKWLKIVPKLLWRLLKFELRGYTVPINTKKAVYMFFINDNKIDNYTWNNIWWTIKPTELNKVLDLIKTDCNETGLDPYSIIMKLISKNLIVANKI